MVNERPIGMATPTVNELEDEIAKLEAENQKLRNAISGEWDGYGWKDGKYIDSLADYFEQARESTS